MRMMHLDFRKWAMLSGVPAFLLSCVFTAGQTTSTQTPSQNSASSGVTRDNDATRRELANFDEFLDGHREIAEQVRKDPSLLDNQQFLKDHPTLQRYLWDHPGVREEAKANPNAFMHQEERYDRAEDAATREKLASFDQFLHKHHELAEQLRKEPSLLDNQRFLKDHPELQGYLQDHPGVRNAVMENPTAFMHEEERYDQRDDARDRDRTRGELASFDQFLDRHRELAEQLRKEPSLLDNQQFLKDHPDLQTYMQDHPGVRNAVMENPTAFMHEEERYDQRDDARDRGRTREELASFDQFLDKHRELAEQVHRNPSLLDDQQFLKNHPVLQAYLQDHPGVRQEVQANPNAFMRMEDQYGRTEVGRRDPDMGHRQFGEFLGGHDEIARDLTRDASLAKNDEYLHSHPELQAYLQAHADVREQLMADPQGFCQSSQQFISKPPAMNPAGKTTTAPSGQPPKQ